MLRSLKIRTASTARASSRMEIGRRVIDLSQVSQEDIVVDGHAASEIAIGEHADETAGFVDDGHGAGLGAGHGEKGFLHRKGFGGDRVAVAVPHDVGDAKEEGSADGAGGMALGEIALLESAGVEDGHGEGIAQDEGGGGAAGGGEIEGTGLAGNGDVEGEIAVAGEGGTGGGGEGNDPDGETAEGGEQVEEFLGFTRVGKGEDQVAVADDAEIAVEGIDGIEDDGGGTGGAEGGGDLAADDPGFADADDDDLVVMDKGVDGEIDGLGEGFVEVPFDRTQRRDLGAEDVPGALEVGGHGGGG